MSNTQKQHSNKEESIFLTTQNGLEGGILNDYSQGERMACRVKTDLGVELYIQELGLSNRVVSSY